MNEGSKNIKLADPKLNSYRYYPELALVDIDFCVKPWIKILLETKIPFERFKCGTSFEILVEFYEYHRSRRKTALAQATNKNKHIFDSLRFIYYPRSVHSRFH